MSETGWLIIKTLCNGLTGTFGLLAAVLLFLEEWRQGKHERARAWFRRKWTTISSSRWLTMPERVIEWLLDSRERFGGRLWSWFSIQESAHYRTLKGCVLAGLMYATVLAVAFGSALSGRDLRWAYVAHIPVVALAVVAVVTVRLLSSRWPQWLITLLVGVLSLSYVAVGGAGAIMALTRLNLAWATLIMLVTIPVWWIFLLCLIGVGLVVLEELGLVAVGQEALGAVSDFCIGVGASFEVTLVALLLGHNICPSPTSAV